MWCDDFTGLLRDLLVCLNIEIETIIENKNFKKLSKTTTIVDYSFLVSLDSGSDTADVVVIYKDNLANY